MLIFFGAVAAMCGGQPSLFSWSSKELLSRWISPFDKLWPPVIFGPEWSAFSQSFVDDARLEDFGETADISEDERKEEMFATITWWETFV